MNAVSKSFEKNVIFKLLLPNRRLHLHLVMLATCQNNFLYCLSSCNYLTYTNLSYISISHRSSNENRHDNPNISILNMNVKASDQ